MEIPDPESPEDLTRTRYVSAQKYPIRLDIGKLTGGKKVGRKRKNLTFPELAWRIRNSEKEYALLPTQVRRIEVCRDRVEAHQRICLAMAPLMFVLIAIPLGITSHRKESSIGMLMSLGIMFLYYLFIIVSDTLDKHPEIYPWLIPWIPILGGQIGGLWLLRRAN